MPRSTWVAIMTILSFSADLSMTDHFKDPDATGNESDVTMKSVSFTLAKPDKPLILLATRVNDEGPFRFVLDTGAGATIITPGLAAKLGIKTGEEGVATGAGGQVNVHLGTVMSLKVGQTQLEKLDVGIMDLEVISSAIETDIDGLIGYNFLKHFRVTIDYPKQTVTFE